jgi:hypothetical protein
MRIIFKVVRQGAALGLLAFAASVSNAQSLYITPPRQHIANRPFSGVETLTLDLVVDGGIGSAVAWGTQITLVDTSTLRFVPNFGGTNMPFRSTQSFFDMDLSDAWTPGSGSLSLNFANFTPGEVLGSNGMVTLGQFQVQVLQEPNYPSDFPFGGRIELASLDVPPFGSAVQDEFGNNLLDAAFGASITSRPPTPEPSTWLTMICGAGVGLLMLRRKRKFEVISAE